MDLRAVDACGSSVAGTSAGVQALKTNHTGAIGRQLAMRRRLGIIQITVVLALACSPAAVAAPGARIARAELQQSQRETARQPGPPQRLPASAARRPADLRAVHGAAQPCDARHDRAATCWSPQQWAVFRYTGGALAHGRR